MEARPLSLKHRESPDPMTENIMISWPWKAGQRFAVTREMALLHGRLFPNQKHQGQLMGVQWSCRCDAKSKKLTLTESSLVEVRAARVDRTEPEHG